MRSNRKGTASRPESPPLTAAAHSCTIRQFHLPPDPRVSAEERTTAESRAREHASEEAATAERDTAKAEQLLEEWRQPLLNRVGKDNWQRFRHLLWTERMAARGRLRVPGRAADDAQKIAAYRKGRAQAFLKELGVAPDGIRELMMRERQKLDRAFAPPRPSVKPSVYDVATFREQFRDLADGIAKKYLELPPRDAKTPPDFLVHTPPYPGWQSGFSFVPSGETWRFERADFTNPEAGLVGHHLKLHNDDAGDMTYGGLTGVSQIAFWFDVPATGVVEAAVELQCFDATIELCTEDEWGWSDSRTYFENTIMMHVLHPAAGAPSLARTAFFVYDTDEDQCLKHRLLPEGARFFVTLKSNGAVPAGETVLLRAGTRSHIGSFSNDVTIHASMRFQYVVRSVTVRVAQ